MSAKLPTLALIGAGRIGAVHGQTIVGRLPEVRLAAIADPRPGAAADLAGRLRVAQAFADPQAAIAAADAVLICSDTASHPGLVKAAAAAGKHIFCEKPLALELAEVDEMVAAAKRAGVKLMVGFNRRFDPDFAFLREAVAGGRIGRPELLRITSRDPAPPPAGYGLTSGGLFRDMTIHDFDMARYLLGDEVVELYALADRLVTPDGDLDTALISLRFAGGALGAIDNSRRARYGYDQRAEVHGSEGLVSNANHPRHNCRLAGTEGFQEPPLLDFFMTRYLASYEAELTAFVKAVVGDYPPPCSGEDGRVALALALAAQRSVELQRPVRISEFG